MLNHCKRISGLFFCLLVTAMLTVTVPLNLFTEVQPPQTEILTKSEADHEVRVFDWFNAMGSPDVEDRPNRVAFDILRWHNHTINLHLRNVRSRWLTYQQPEHSVGNITYPSEEASAS